MASTAPRLIALSGSAVLCLGLITGCSSTSELDVQKAQDEIAKGIQEQTGESVTVSCPDPVQIQQGATFTCTALSPSGEGGTVEVTQTDDQGTISWRLEPGVVTPSPS